MMRTKCFLILIIQLFSICAFSQKALLCGRITDKERNFLNKSTLSIPKLNRKVGTDKEGNYKMDQVPFGKWRIVISHLGFQMCDTMINIDSTWVRNDFVLEEIVEELDDVVISGTMQEVSKLESPVPVGVYTSKFFEANPTPSIFDALQQINGVRPQLNCNICNTGDIHINGLEGPYTMILIDGMPIVSGLSTVYGLSGIPRSLIDRVEIVKGPASTLYGSEAVGGLINIITKSPINVPTVSAEVFTTSWAEVNADMAAKFRAAKKVQSLLGVNYFNYSRPIDQNSDNFTDVTLQNRISIFNKWNIERKNIQKVFSLAGRYVYEDRWGGEMQWQRRYRGGDEVYGEHILTARWEFFGAYHLPFKEKILLQLSANGHHQNSVYGNTSYLADQKILFSQVTWNKNIQSHDFLLGLTYRYTFYDDNTPATVRFMYQNQPQNTHLPGLFVQDAIALKERKKLLLGMRLDHNSLHGFIFTPRVNFKWHSRNQNSVFRAGIGNGYRVANVFTEDHSALTGARELIFNSNLKPETSWNANLNLEKKMSLGNTAMNLDVSVFYTYFTNKIIADYDTDPNKIIYDNLSNYAVSRGMNLQMDVTFIQNLKISAGATLMEVFSVQNQQKIGQMFTENFGGTWNISYNSRKMGLMIDYTGNIYAPMRLPLLSVTDPRSAYSPWWSMQNIQLTKKMGANFEVYGGVKNFLNWTPNKGNPFIIARADDPFDKNVQFDARGQAMVTSENPYGLTFDPNYVYAPNQGIRGFIGLRLKFN